MPRHAQDFQTIRSEGGLLPPDLLRRVLDPKQKLEGTRPEDYGLPQGERLNGVNTLGVPEISPVVFEELLVNALIHRHYLVSASIRLFIFDDRIEIISPGHLPDNPTVEKIRNGSSNLRNPILVSHVAKGVLPYRGLGSGIQRALESWAQTEFRDDHEGCLFTAIIRREVAVKVAVKVAAKIEEQILELLDRKSVRNAWPANRQGPGPDCSGLGS